MKTNREWLNGMTNDEFAEEIIKWYSEQIFPIDGIKKDYAHRLLEQWLWEEPQKKDFDREQLRGLFHDRFCGRGRPIEYQEIDRFIKEIFK